MDPAEALDSIYNRVDTERPSAPAKTVYARRGQSCGSPIVGFVLLFAGQLVAKTGVNNLVDT